MYYIRLSKKQLQVVADALDLYSRVLSGDLGEAIDVFNSEHFPEYNIDLVNQYMDIVCKQLTNGELPLDANYGIFSDKTPKKAKIAYEIFKSIMHHFWKWDSNKNSISVHSRLVKDLTKEPEIKIQRTFEILKKKLKNAKNNN